MKTVTTALLVSAILATSASALADEAPVPAPQPPAEPTPPAQVVAPADPAKPSDPAPPTPGVPTPEEKKSEQITNKQEEKRWRIYGAVSAAVTKPSVNGQLGGRYRLSERFMVGLDAEVDGFIGVQTPSLRTGVLNIYATGIYRIPLRFEQINLRTTLQLGTSTMLVDLYGAPRGTTGIYLGGVPLGIEWKLSDHFFVIFDILGVALPVPQLKGAPFAYPQYRTAAGVEIAF